MSFRISAIQLFCTDGGEMKNGSNDKNHFKGVEKAAKLISKDSWLQTAAIKFYKMYVKVTYTKMDYLNVPTNKAYL